MGKKNKGPPRAKGPNLLVGDWFCPELEAALVSTFERFDQDEDGVLSVAELQAFARVCNDGEEFGPEELEDLKYFNTDKRGQLTRKGFLEMYHMQTVARPSDTRKDMRALGFDAQLKPSSEGAPASASATSAAASATASPSASQPPPVDFCVDAARVAAGCARSDALYTDGKHKESLREAMAALQLDGSCAAAHQCVGRALFALGRVDAAERSWARANELAAVSGGAKEVAAVAVASAEEAAAAVGEEAPTFVGAFSLDLVQRLCLKSAFLAPTDVVALEGTCRAMRDRMSELQLWRRWVKMAGWSDQLRIEPHGEEGRMREAADSSTAPSTATLRRLVLLETARRESFPSRLRDALARLGLPMPGTSAGGGTSPRVARTLTPAEAETCLRLCQWRHGFLLDRRYARAYADGNVDDRAFAFLPDSLPGSVPPHLRSPDSAVAVVASTNVGPDARPSKGLAYPQRIAFLPPEPLNQLAKKTSLGKQTLETLLRAHNLDEASKPTVEELREGRDIELCAMAPLDTERPGTRAGIFENRDVLANPWEDDAESIATGLSKPLPTSARFSWTLDELQHLKMGRYHRMAVYTHRGWPETPRHATSAERAICAQLHQHGLQRRDHVAPRRAAEGAGGSTCGIPAPDAPAASSAGVRVPAPPPLEDEQDEVAQLLTEAEDGAVAEKGSTPGAPFAQILY
jgi:hypothetical protein